MLFSFIYLLLLLVDLRLLLLDPRLLLVEFFRLIIIDLSHSFSSLTLDNLRMISAPSIPFGLTMDIGGTS